MRKKFPEYGPVSRASNVLPYMTFIVLMAYLKNSHIGARRSVRCFGS